MQEVQVITVSGASGGTFRLVHANTATEAIPFDASPTDLEVAIGKLPSLGKVKVKLEESDRGGVVTFVSLPGDVATLTATSSLTGGTVSDSVDDAPRWHLTTPRGQDQGRVRREPAGRRSSRTILNKP